MGKLERTKRHASFTNLLASEARPIPTELRIILMALRHDANDANLSRIADDLIGIRELLDKMDHSQDALLENGQSIQGQLEALTGQITHLIRVLTPERPEQEGPSLADLLARILTQQIGNDCPAAPDQRHPDAAYACRSRHSPRQHSRQQGRPRLIPRAQFQENLRRKRRRGDPRVHDPGPART